jgi:hypothetical protein
MLRHDPVARPTARMCREVVEMIVNGEHPKAGDIKSQQIPKDQVHSNYGGSATKKGSQQTAKDGGAVAVQKPQGAQNVNVGQVMKGAQQVKATAQQSAQQTKAQQGAQQAKATAQQSVRQAKEQLQQGAQQAKQAAQQAKDKAQKSAQEAKEQLQQGAQQAKQAAQQIKQGAQQVKQGAQQVKQGAQQAGGHASPSGARAQDMDGSCNARTQKVVEREKGGANSKMGGVGQDWEVVSTAEAGREGEGAGVDAKDLMNKVKGKMKALFGYQSQVSKFPCAIHGSNSERYGESMNVN